MRHPLTETEKATGLFSKELTYAALFILAAIVLFCMIIAPGFDAVFWA